MGLWKRLSGRIFPQRGRSFQHQLDLYEAAFLTRFFKLHAQEASLQRGFRSKDALQEIAGEMEETSDLLRRSELEDNICEQMKAMMSKVRDMGGFDPYPVRKSDEHEMESYVSVFDRKKDVEIWKKQMEHPAGFSLSILPSVVEHPESGLGVHVSGFCPAGTVVAMYPGHVYFPGTLPAERLKDNEYLISRYDGVVVDGEQWDHLADDARMLRRGYEYLGADLVFYLEHKGKKNVSVSSGGSVLTEDPFHNRYKNPYGIGSFVNHPPLLENEFWDDDKLHPKSAEANVVSIGFDFSEEEWSNEPELLSYLPYEVKGGKTVTLDGSNTLMPSIVFIASRHIQDEEVFVNYRFNPNNPYPSWYGQPDLETAKRRWGRIGWSLKGL